MSNSSIISRLQRVLDDYALGIHSSNEVATLSEASMTALESTTIQDIQQARSFCDQLIECDYWTDEGFIPAEPRSAIIQEFHEFLNALLAKYKA
jgi:hypothetical protein